jgi:hypothetical protein
MLVTTMGHQQHHLNHLVLLVWTHVRTFDLLQHDAQIIAQFSKPYTVPLILSQTL